jgi:hypothetical protein
MGLKKSLNQMKETFNVHYNCAYIKVTMPYVKIKKQRGVEDILCGSCHGMART